MIIIQSVIQSCIVFIFLTIFFYLYVSQIERDEFETQLDKIVDDIFSEYQYKFKSFFPDNKKKKDIEKKLFITILLYKYLYM